MTNSRKYSLISILVILALAFALFFTMAVLPVRISATAEDAEPGEHMHDEITFTAWTSTTSLPSAAGNYYLTGNVTLGGTWTKPGGTVNLCLNGFGIKTTSGRVILVNGGIFNLYDCGTATHYFDVDGNGKAINVNDESGDKSFTGGYITGGNGGRGLGQTSYYWGEGGGILVWSGTFNMYGGTILGNYAGHGGGVEVVNATMNMYGGDIIHNQCGEGGSAVNLRSQSGNTVTMNLYDGNLCYNKGTVIDQSYCYGSRKLNIYGGNISNNNGTAVWCSNLLIDGSPVVEGNTGRGVGVHSSMSVKGSPVIRDNASGNFWVNTNCVITLTGALDIEPTGVTMREAAGGVFTSGWSTYMGDADPTDYFVSDAEGYQVDLSEGEAKLSTEQPVTIYVADSQDTTKTLSIKLSKTVATAMEAAANEFGVDAEDYKLVYAGTPMQEASTLKSYSVQNESTLQLVSRSNLKNITLVPSATTTATETTPGFLDAVRQGDTITITYASTHNDGMVEMLVTTAFDESLFHLTSFSVDEAHYSLLNDYGYDTPITAAEFIRQHNAALNAGEEPYTDRLSFVISYKDGVRDNVGYLSDHFITVTYTAVKDVPGGTEFSFGFDMSKNGAYTNAAWDGDTLLEIVDADNVTVTEKMVTFAVKGAVSATIPEGQTLYFHRSETNGIYALSEDDILLRYLQPAFEVGEENPYLADGGTRTFVFYTKNEQDEYIPILDVNDNPILPIEVGEYYVKAVFTATTLYLGSETEIVPITVTKTTIDLPEILLRSSDREEAEAMDTETLILTMTGVVYGSELSPKELVEGVEADLGLPDEGGPIDELVYSYTKKDAEGVYQPYYGDVNFFAVENLSVGEYQLTISLRNDSYVAFAGTDLTALHLYVNIVHRPLTVRTLIGGESSVALTYGDAAPEASEFTYTVEGILESEEELILNELAFEVTSENSYEQYDAVGTYLYTATVTGEVPSNYTIADNLTAEIVVSAKALSIGVEYEGGVATFAFSGVVNDDEVNVVYSVDGVDLAANIYTAVAADLEKETIVATVTPDNANYAAANKQLLAVYGVTFGVTEPFAAATGMPDAQYIFEGCLASAPADPACERYAFKYWYTEDALVSYDFDTPVTESIALTAEWEQVVFEYKFRALNSEASFERGVYRDLKWENDRFVLADGSESFPFTKNTEIPMTATIGSFRVARWVKAVKVEDAYTYTVVERFEAAVGVENDEDAYYIAVMTLDLGMGDVDGDGSITAADIVRMKKYLVGVRYTTLNSESAVWQAIGEEVPAGGYFYSFLWDVNDDGHADTRDILASREALATGYAYEIVSDVNVNGVIYSNEVVIGPTDSVFETDVTAVADAEALFAALDSGKKVGLLADIEITDEENETRFNASSDLYIDLGGKTLKVGNLILNTTGKITLKNGVLDMASGIALIAEDGVYTTGLKKADGDALSDNNGETVVQFEP